MIIIIMAYHYCYKHTHITHITCITCVYIYIYIYVYFFCFFSEQHATSRCIVLGQRLWAGLYIYIYIYIYNIIYEYIFDLTPLRPAEVSAAKGGSGNKRFSVLCLLFFCFVVCLLCLRNMSRLHVTGLTHLTLYIVYMFVHIIVSQSQQVHKSMHFVRFGWKCARVATFCHILLHVETCLHIRLLSPFAHIFG